MADGFQVRGKVDAALFDLVIHRGDGMAMLAMNWKVGPPPDDFSGFAIEFTEPGGKTPSSSPLKNLFTFPDDPAKPAPTLRAEDRNATNWHGLPSLDAPFQRFRWIHFPWIADIPGEYSYTVTPVFMNPDRTLRHGTPQTAAVALRRETYPGQLNVGYTRGFISSQAFIGRWKTTKGYLPNGRNDPLTFPVPKEHLYALSWMGFEAAEQVVGLLREAATGTAQVRVVAFELNQPAIIDALKAIGPRLKIIIDDSKKKKDPDSDESRAAAILAGSAGKDNVRRQHMGSLQHNKTIVIDGGPGGVQRVLAGSTNFTWRGLYVQNNSAVTIDGPAAVAAFSAAFDTYWENAAAPKMGTGDFPESAPATWTDLQLTGIDAHVTFSPHDADNSILKELADAIAGATSSVFYSLAFLYESPSIIRDAIAGITKRTDRFVYGMSDKSLGGIVLSKPDGNPIPVSKSALSAGVPAPFSKEPGMSAAGTQIHHKFVVIDPDTDHAKVYVGSYNFSEPADGKNGENLLRIADRRVAVSYLVEALAMFDHYSFRIRQNQAAGKAPKGQAPHPMGLALAPSVDPTLTSPWWQEYYDGGAKERDRIIFCPPQP